MFFLSQLLSLMVGLLHIWFLILEMFLWRTPKGLKTFQMTQEQADSSAVLAANQGLYNGFLAAGLIFSFFLSLENQFVIRVFCLSCVTVAGLYGAWSVNRKILFVQAIPGALGLGSTFLAS